MSAPAFDAEALRRSYRAMPRDELLVIVSTEAHEYEAEAVEIARAELRERGADDAQLEEAVRDLKARRFDELMAAGRPPEAKLPRWMFWVCLIESSTISLFIIIYLGSKGRGRAFQGALAAISIGWVIKFCLTVAVRLFPASIPF